MSIWIIPVSGGHTGYDLGNIVSIKILKFLDAVFVKNLLTFMHHDNIIYIAGCFQSHKLAEPMAQNGCGTG